MELNEVLKEQVGGNHYDHFAIQPAHFIVTENLDFIQGCIIKYIARYKFKNGLEDLRKAQHYAKMGISQNNLSKYAPLAAAQRFVKANNLSKLQANIIYATVQRDYYTANWSIIALARAEYIETLE